MLLEKSQADRSDSSHLKVLLGRTKIGFLVVEMGRPLKWGDRHRKSV